MLGCYKRRALKVDELLQFRNARIGCGEGLGGLFAYGMHVFINAQRLTI